MACLTCEEYAKRISNLYRDEELREKFLSLTGINIEFNLFICDSCLKQMLDALSFRDKCISMHNKNNQSVKQESWKDTDDENHFIEEHLIEEENIPVVQIVEHLEEEDKYHISQLDEATLNLNQEEIKETYVIEEDCKLSETEHRIKENQEIICDESKERRKRKSYVSSEKLKIIAYAEVTGNRQAGKLYKIDESLVRKWRSQKNLLLEITQERDTKRKPNLRFPEIEIQLKEFVQKKIQEGVHLQPREIKAEAMRIANEMNISSFKGTSSYIFKFMERYKYTKKHKIN